MAPVRGLYPIVDLDTLAKRNLAALTFAEAVLTARPPILQLRAKHQTPRAVLDLLDQLKPLCAQSGTQLFANDRPDLALLAGVAGVHVGQDDLPVEAVRRLAGGLRIGVSTHDLAQLTAALALRPDYVAFGPIFATSTKAGADPALGIEMLDRAAALARAANIPLCVIGGLSLNIAPRLARHRLLAAVISDLLVDGTDAPAIASRSAAWNSALSIDS